MFKDVDGRWVHFLDPLDESGGGVSGHIKHPEVTRPNKLTGSDQVGRVGQPSNGPVLVGRPPDTRDYQSLTALAVKPDGGPEQDVSEPRVDERPELAGEALRLVLEPNRYYHCILRVVESDGIEKL